MPGKPINDQQARLYMEYRRTLSQEAAAAKAGFSLSTGQRLEKDPRLPSQKKAEHRRGGSKPDPLAGVWETDVLPLLGTCAGIRPIRDASSSGTENLGKGYYWHLELFPEAQSEFALGEDPCLLCHYTAA